MLSILYHAEHRAALDLADGIHYMESDDFEWDDAKAEANVRKHKINFRTAARVFDDPFVLIEQEFQRGLWRGAVSCDRAGE